MFILLFLLFFVLCGRFTPDAGTLEICIAGAIISALVYLFAYRAFGITPKKELSAVRDVFWLIIYVFVLVYEVLCANITLITLILRKDAEYHPAIVKINVPLKRTLTRVLLANSITLTPGTITVDVNGNEYTVHCLDKSFSRGIDDGIFVTLLKKIDR